MSAADLSVAMLKQSLEANGLATYGTKKQMWDRLISGETEKKKPGPKPKGDVPKKKKQKTSAAKGEPIDGEEKAFMDSERPRLAAYISDFDEQTAELETRWNRIKKAKKDKDVDGVGSVKIPAPLDAAQMAAMNLRFVSTETSPTTGATLYVYASTSAPAAAEDKSKPAEKQESGKKRKMPCDEEENEDDEDGEDDMSWACEVAAMRLAKCRKELLITLCHEFNIPATGTKEELAENLSEQLHYETDDEEEDDE